MRQHSSVVPDGGWGWVIVACSFLIHLFVVGSLYALSVLYLSWLDAFQNSKGYTSVILSLAVAVMFGIGPLPGALSKRISNRLVVVLGGLLMFAGFLSSVFAVNVLYLIFSVGILTGVGAGCCYLPSVSMVAMYFSSKRSAAMGISASGLGVGAFLMPLCLNWMVENYGWRGCMLILSGLSLNMCVLGLLMRPLESAPKCRNCKWIEESEVFSDEESLPLPLMYTKRESVSGDESDEDCEDCNTTCGVVDDSRNVSFLGSCRHPVLPVVRVSTPGGKLEPPSNHIPAPMFVHQPLGSGDEIKISHNKLKDSQHIISTSESNRFIGKTPLMFGISKDGTRFGGSLQYINPTAHNNIRKSTGLSLRSLDAPPGEKQQRPNVSSLNGIQIMMAGSLYNVVHSARAVRSIMSLQSLDSMVIIDTSQVHLSVEKLDQDKIPETVNDAESVIVEYKQQENQLGRSGCKKSKLQKHHNKLMAALGTYLKLMQHGTFMLFCISNFLTNLSFFMPVLYMVDRAVYEGFAKTEAAMLVSVYGAGNIFGKLFFGWLADRGLIDRLAIYIGCLTVCGAATSLSPLCGDSQLLHSIYSFSFGCFIGSYCTLFPIVTVDLVGLDAVEESFGILLCFMGVATAFGAPLAGSIFDWTGNYTSAFALHGAFILISALMLVPLLVIRSCKKR